MNEEKVDRARIIGIRETKSYKKSLSENVRIGTVLQTLAEGSITLKETYKNFSV